MQIRVLTAISVLWMKREIHLEMDRNRLNDDVEEGEKLEEKEEEKEEEEEEGEQKEARDWVQPVPSECLTCGGISLQTSTLWESVGPWKTDQDQDQDCPVPEKGLLEGASKVRLRAAVERAAFFLSRKTNKNSNPQTLNLEAS